jgi:hypothetical protein
MVDELRHPAGGAVRHGDHLEFMVAVVVHPAGPPPGSGQHVAALEVAQVGRPEGRDEARTGATWETERTGSETRVGVSTEPP